MSLDVSEFKVATFDVFDTLLVRAVGDPKDVFLLVGSECGRRNFLSLGPENFRSARIQAEDLARANHDHKECSLDDIYEVLGRLLALEKENVVAIKQLELEIEAGVLRGIPGGIALLEKERALGKRILFLSDMYLPSDWLREQLVRLAGARSEEPLWVSHEHRASKYTGALFQTALAALEAEAGDCVHYGNDAHSDVAMARKAGIRGVLLDDGNLASHERRLQELKKHHPTVISALVGAARLTRLSGAVTEEEKLPVVAGTLLPLHYMYCVWILANARRLGLRRLYFVSRDGWLPLQVTSWLCRKLGVDIECRYLYGSRQAWHLAGLQGFGAREKEWIMGSMDGETFGSLLKRIGLTCEEWRENTPATEVWPESESGVSGELREKIWHELQKPDGQAARLALEKGRQARNLLLDYLAQQGVLQGGDCGFIELGWSGRTARSFERAIDKNDLTSRFHWFYLGLLTNVSVLDEQRVHYFLFGPRQRMPQIYDASVVAESFSLADHGSVLGYEREPNGEVVPQLRQHFESSLDGWGRGAVLACARRYLQCLTPQAEHLEDCHALRLAASALLERFCERPTTTEAEIWGTFPFEHDQHAHSAVELAPPAKFDLAGVRKALIFGTLSHAVKGHSMSAWAGARWSRRHWSAWGFLPFVIAGQLRVHGPRKAAGQWQRALRAWIRQTIR